MIATALVLTLITYILIQATGVLIQKISQINLYTLRGVALSFENSLFSTEGFPPDWEKTLNVVKLGLMKKLYRVRIKVEETAGKAGYFIFNFSYEFDENCSKNITPSSIRIFDRTKEIPFSIFNQSYCFGKYLKNASLSANISLNPKEIKILEMYFSNEEVKPISFEVPSNASSNVKVSLLPLEEFQMLSFSKLKGLRKLDYGEVKTILETNYNFRIEVEHA